MLYLEKTQTSAMASSLIDWWKMAGVEYTIDDASIDWLQADPVKATSAISVFETGSAPFIAPKSATGCSSISQSDWPTDIITLHNAIKNGQQLPGNYYGGKSAVPVGFANAQMMIFSDLPDIEEIDEGRLGAGQSGRLLVNIVKAIGYDIADCYLTALATTRPATGELPDDDLINLAEFALHQINLVNPQTLLILGSAACRALLGADLIAARGNLPDIKHIVGNKAATPTFHPRTLLARPILKAQAWKDLQMIVKKDVL
jgi:uracil-DNA glycosylase